MQYTSGLVTPERCNDLLNIVAEQIRADEEFYPDTIIGLSTGGFFVASALAKRLSIPSRDVVGLPAYKDEVGDYHLDEELVCLRSCKGRRGLIVDDAADRGLLTRKVVGVVAARGGIARSCVLMANQDGIQPDYVGETCVGRPPKFFWEFTA